MNEIPLSSPADDSLTGMLSGTQTTRHNYRRIFSNSSSTLTPIPLEPPTNKPHRKLITYILFGTTTVLILLSTYLLIFNPDPLTTLTPSSLLIRPKPHSLPSKFRSLGTCGNTSTTALANGCVFDPMSILWVRPECYDASLTAEFNRQYSDNYGWYRSANLTEGKGYDLVPMEEVERGEWDEGLWVDWRYHQLHCTFGWRKMHRALLGRGAIDDTSLGYGHTVHCEDMLVNWGDSHPGTVNTRVRLGYSNCLEIII